MKAIALKHWLSKHLSQLSKLYKREYNFDPKTWILQSDLADFRTQFEDNKDSTFIIKPVNMCQGRGIFLSKRMEDIGIKAGE